jgi:GNAT superfamily N-acetyltransferase
MSYTIKPIKRKDLLSVFQLRNALFGRAQTDILQHLAECREVFRIGSQKILYRNKLCGFVVAIPEDNVGTFGVFYDHQNGDKSFSEKFMYISQIGIKKEHQKKGLGSRLVGVVEHLAKREGLEKITLLAKRESIPFWEKNGFALKDDEYNYNSKHYCFTKTI